MLHLTHLNFRLERFLEKQWVYQCQKNVSTELHIYAQTNTILWMPGTQGAL